MLKRLTCAVLLGLALAAGAVPGLGAASDPYEPPEGTLIAPSGTQSTGPANWCWGAPPRGVTACGDSVGSAALSYSLVVRDGDVLRFDVPADLEVREIRLQIRSAPRPHPDDDRVQVSKPIKTIRLDQPSWRADFPGTGRYTLAHSISWEHDEPRNAEYLFGVTVKRATPTASASPAVRPATTASPSVRATATPSRSPASYAAAGYGGPGSGSGRTGMVTLAGVLFALVAAARIAELRRSPTVGTRS